jgi:tetratricopeptide (TPR) repeat protein
MRACHVVDRVHSQYHETEFWDRLVHSGPSLALDEIASILATTALDRDVRALAYSAEARSLFELGRIREASLSARSALDTSHGVRRDVRATVAMSSSVIVAEAGFVDEALASLEQLSSESSGVELGRVRLQIAYVLHQAGRLNAALLELDVSERLFHSGGEDRDRIRVHLNRGLVLLQQGRLSAAQSDFELAALLAEALGMVVVHAQSVANQAVLHGRARRLAESLRDFDRAARLFEQAGNPSRTVAHMEIDRAEVMMRSGLLLDAIDAGRAAIARVENGGNQVLLGDANLMLARVELAAGQTRAATMSAARAEHILRESGRTDVAPQATAIGVMARLIGARSAAAAEAPLAEAVSVIERLRAHGWDAEADELALARVRTGYRWRLDEQISDDVAGLRLGAFAGLRHTALAGWYTEAIGRILAGDTAWALDACLSGLDLLDDIVAEAETLEQRSAAMQLGHHLSELTIELAVGRRDAHIVLSAAEGTRARALHEELASTDRHRPLTEEGAERLRAELAGRLGQRILVEWVVARDEVWAVVFGAGGSRLVEVGDRDEVLRARDRLLVWLDLAALEPDESSVRAMRAAELLDRLIIEPLGLPEGAEIVLVPVDLLHGIPWCGLPSFAGRALSLSPNAQVWLEADRRAAGTARSVALVVGPDLAGAAVERRAIERVHDGAAVAAGFGATAATVRSMFAQADLVHVAAHGTFRSDHPLLSTLRLHDGEATLYDAVPDRVRSKLVVLSSCEGGAQGTADGSEVLGLSAVLLARGAAAVLAPLTVVRDLECADFVAEVHAELAEGAPVAGAVANVRKRWLADDDLSRWAVASSFTCFGSGAVTLAT